MSKVVRFENPKLDYNIFSCKLLLSYCNNSYFGQDIINCDEQFNKLEDILKWICTTLAKAFSKLQIDFPQDYEEFQLLWFKSHYFKGDVFTYFLHNGNKFIEPWERQDIYEIVLDFMQKVDEENQEEEHYEEHHEEQHDEQHHEEQDDEVRKLENIIKDIISKS